jgi:two-component system chemotaxis response regulator CheY
MFRKEKMPDQNTHRIVVAEDNPVVREVLRGVIRQDKSLAIVGEAAHGQGALDLVDSLAPDLVCLDILMPGMDGISVLRTMREKHPATRVIVVTGQSTSEVVTEALKLGAAGFVVKPFNAEKLLRAIHNALATREA